MYFACLDQMDTQQQCNDVNWAQRWEILLKVLGVH